MIENFELILIKVLQLFNEVYCQSLNNLKIRKKKSAKNTFIREKCIIRLICYLALTASEQPAIDMIIFTGQRTVYFDRCHFTITWMSTMKEGR